MEDYAGKTCPFCKTEIKQEDAVKVCPVCGIPHHAGCWEENQGCTTFGCPEQHYEPQGTNITDVCVKCGALLGDGQAFCAKCGTPRNASNPSVCSKCGAQLQQGQAFCPKCGQKVDLVMDAGVSSAINQFNSGVQKKKKKSLVVPVVIAAVVVIGVFAGVLINNIVQEKKREEAKVAYIANVLEFSDQVSYAQIGLEYIAYTCQQYWYDAIWNDMYNDDINVAIAAALSDTQTMINSAGEDYGKISSLYQQINTLPEGVEDDELEDVCDAVKELYNSYTDYYDFATNPSGNYNSFSAAKITKDEAMKSASRVLENLGY